MDKVKHACDRAPAVWDRFNTTRDMLVGACRCHPNDSLLVACFSISLVLLCKCYLIVSANTLASTPKLPKALPSVGTVAANPTIPRFDNGNSTNAMLMLFFACLSYPTLTSKLGDLLPFANMLLSG